MSLPTIERITSGNISVPVQNFRLVRVNSGFIITDLDSIISISGSATGLIPEHAIAMVEDGGSVVVANDGAVIIGPGGRAIINTIGTYMYEHEGVFICEQVERVIINRLSGDTVPVVTPLPALPVQPPRSIRRLP